MAFNGNSQTTKTTISKIKVAMWWGIKGEFTRTIDLNTNDTAYYVYMSYQNRRYQHIVDIGSIMIWDQKTLTKFRNRMYECTKYMNYRRQNIRFNHNDYELYVTDHSRNLYFNSPRGDEYTYLGKVYIIKLLKWLNTITIPE